MAGVVACLSSAGVNVAVLMSSGFIFGNMLKNAFCIPRPPSHLVHRARPSDADDYSMPSTHSLQAISLPLWLTVYLVRECDVVSWSWFAWWIPAALTWMLCISWSRLYLGAHTVQDVVMGWIVGAVISIAYCFIYPHLGPKLLAGDAHACGQLFAFSLLVMYLHPMEVFINTSMSKWSIIVSQSGYLTSCDLAGVLAGIAIGVPITPKSFPISVLERPYTSVIRFLVGGTLAAIIYVLARKTLRSILLLGYNAVGIPTFDPPAKTAQIPPTLTLKKEGDRVSFESLNVYKFNNGPAPNFQWLTQSYLGLLLLGSGIQVMPIAKFLQYTALSWTVSTGAPLLLEAIGL